MSEVERVVLEISTETTSWGQQAERVESMRGPDAKTG